MIKVEELKLQVTKLNRDLCMHFTAETYFPEVLENIAHDDKKLYFIQVFQASLRACFDFLGQNLTLPPLHFQGK